MSSARKSARSNFSSVGFLDSVVILLVSTALVTFLLWVTSRLMQVDLFENLPGWLENSYHNIWTSVATGGAGGSLALLKALRRKPGAPTPNYLWLIVIFTCGMFAAIFFLSKMVNHNQAAVLLEPWANIENPKSNEVVRRKTIDCSGEVRNVPPGRHLWLVVELDNGMQWPKEAGITIGAQGKWRPRIFQDAPVDKFSIALYMVDAVGDESIRRWIETSKQTGHYSALFSVPGIRLDRVDDLKLQIN